MNNRSYEERWDPDEVEECCNLWDLSEEERIQLLQLKEEILALPVEDKEENNKKKDDDNNDDDIVMAVNILKNHWKNDPFEVVRFLKEFQHTNDNTVSAISTKFRNSIQWRIQNNVDRILEDYTPPALYNYFPMGVLEGTTLTGDPIYIERTGAADTLGLLQRFGREEMIQQAIWGKELLTRGPWIQQQQPQEQDGGETTNTPRTRRRRRRIKQFVSIIDLKGLNRHHLNPSLVPVGQAVTRLVQDNYPGIANRILVIRAPFFFRFVWNIFKHFVDPHVKELIEIATEQETPDLLRKYMDLKVLPKEIVGSEGGKGTTVSGYQTIWEGGPIPSPTSTDWKRRTPIIFPSNDQLAAVDPAADIYNVTPKLDTTGTATTTSSTRTSNFSFDIHQTAAAATPKNDSKESATATSDAPANASTHVVPPQTPAPRKLTSPDHSNNDDDETTPPLPGTCSSSRSWESLSSSGTTSRQLAPISISILQTPPPTQRLSNRTYSDNRKGDDSGGGLDTCRSWESLTPQPDSETTTSGRGRRKRRSIQQAWTVTPGPPNRYYNSNTNCYNDDDEDEDDSEEEGLWSESKLKDIAQLFNLNNEQDLINLRTLRESTRDIHHWKNNPYELIRFYVDANGNVDKTESKFRKMIIWRMESKMDDDNTYYRHKQPQRMDERTVVHPLFHYMPICVLKGRDREGDPIYIDRIGSCDYYPLLRHFGQDGMIDYITYLRELNSSKHFWQEQQQQQQQQQQQPNDKDNRHPQPWHQKPFTVIVDLEGLNVKHLRPALLALLKRTVKLSQDNYPGWVKRILVIREPPIFKVVWSITKKFFPPQVRSLIEFSSSSSSLSEGNDVGEKNNSDGLDSSMKLLDKYVDREVLPSVICPESTGQVMPGYYENVKLEGGPIPQEVLQKAKKEKKKMMAELTSKTNPSFGSYCVPPAPSPPTFVMSSSSSLLTPPRGGRSSYQSLPQPTLTGSRHKEDNDDSSGSWRPSTPVTTTHLLLGKWDHKEEEEGCATYPKATYPKTETTERKQDSTTRAFATPETKKEKPYQWQSPMFKYNW